MSFSIIGRWSVITANSFISSSPPPLSTPTVHNPLHVSFFFFSHSEVPVNLSGSFSSIWTVILFDVLSLFFHLFGWDVMQWLCGWRTGSFELWFYFQRWIEGIFSNVRLNGWHSVWHFWYNPPPMLKEFRDSLNRNFYYSILSNSSNGHWLLWICNSFALLRTSYPFGSFVPQPCLCKRMQL